MEILYPPILKKWGQNFLTDSNMQKYIANLVNKTSLDVIEVGPGKGAITQHIQLNDHQKLILIEIDKKLTEILKEDFSNKKITEIINEDVLKIDFNELKSKYNLGDIHAISNLPYYISSKIIFTLSEYDFVKEMTLMVQKEMGDRLLANPKTKDYNHFTIKIQTMWDIKQVKKVPRNCFQPIPNVDSVVLSFVRKKEVLWQNQEEKEKFFLFLNICFQQKRKTLWNNLKSSEFSQINDEKFKHTRAEEITIAELFKIFKS